MQQDLETTLTIEEILDAGNVAELLSDRELDDIGQYVYDGYDNDMRSRSEWEDRNDEAMKLALQVVEVKNTPWPNASNVKYPLLTTAALQFASRAYPALVPGTSIVKGRVIGFDHDGSKLDRAIRIGKHMSYQLLEEMDDWEEEMDKLCLALPILGTIFKKTYYCPTKGKNVSEVIFPRDLVINYYAQTIEKAERITHVLELSENAVHERIKSKMFLDIDLEKSNSLEATPEDRDRGLEAPSYDDDTVPYIVLEQHCLLDLDGDGYKEPYIITIDEGSEKVLRIVPRFKLDNIKFNEDNDIIRIEPTDYFTKYGFIPSPDGSIYDIGFGTLLGPINDTVNTLINQLLDAGTLSNSGGGWLGRGMRIRGGEHKFVPGEWKQVNSTGDDIRKSVYPLPIREPSNVLFSLLNTIVSAGERLSSVTEMMSGEIPGQNTKATVAMAAIEQGMKVFNAIYKRVYRAMKKEFRKLYDLNKEYVPLQEYFTILDVGQERAAQISVIDYRVDDTDIIPYADPSIATTEQKLAKLQALGELMALGTINPQEYTKRYLEATEQANVEALMQMPPPRPDPKMQLEQAKLQEQAKQNEHDRQMDMMKYQLEMLAMQQNEIKTQAEVVLKVAQAEGVEAGTQIDAYMAQLDGMVKQSREVTERIKAMSSMQPKTEAVNNAE